ncbi:MAG: hypothetical protein BroJett040_15020 [Oligoflexia bacterium]|nr:MAG: hypothetical protein BroJett040_15020 [Oligoflexia bacterium]
MALIRYFILVILLGAMICLPTGPVLAISPTEEDQILGTWKNIGFIYQGEFRLPLNPNLILLFEFHADGTNEIFWARQNEPGFCERKGKYSIIDHRLEDEVVWINPDNNIECSQDPDMRLGRKASNEIRFKDGKFHLYLSLAGDPFIYVFDRLPTDDRP